MSGEPWNVPETPEGREELRALIEEYRASGQVRELGIALTRMASIVKQIGEKDGKNAWDACIKFGREAVKVLRKTDDRAALVDALNGAHIYLLPKEVRETLSREALAMARELGDPSREGWAIFALAMRIYPNDSLVEGERMEDAIQCFEKAGNLFGKATCLQVMGSKRANGRWKLNLEAAKSYEEAGKFKHSARAYSLAAFWGGDDISSEEAERYLLEGVRVAKAGNVLDMEAMLYGQLSTLWKEAENEEKSRHFAELEDSLDIPLYGSRANRLKHDLELEKDVLDCQEGKHKRDALKRINAMEQELQALEKA